MHKLGAAAKYRLALTGTVITNKPIDVFSQYKFADPSVFGGSFYLFRNRYFDMVGYGKYTPVMKHHIVPLSQGGTHDEANLMALCTSCHSEITAREGGRWG